MTSAVGGSSVRSEISPKKSPRVEPRALRAVDDDVRLALEDHVEAAAGDVLADDALPSAKTSSSNECASTSSCGCVRSAKRLSRASAST